MVQEETTTPSLDSGLAKTLQGIWEASQGKWVSVLDTSISSIFKKNGVPKSYYSPLMDVLKETGMVISDGQRAGMRYKVETYIDPTPYLVEKIIQKQRDYSSEYRKTLPKKSHRKKAIKEESPMVTITKTSLPLGTTVYFLVGNIPFEGVISHATYGNTKENISKIFYKARIKTGIDLSDGFVKVLRLDDNQLVYETRLLCGAKVALTLDALLENIKWKLVQPEKDWYSNIK